MTLPKSAKWAIGAVFVAVALGGSWAYAHDEGGASAQSTDDAYIQSDYSTVAPKVAGLIERVPVEDNQHVRRGQLLAVIDDRDFRVAVAAAQAELDSARSNRRSIRAALDRQFSLIAQAAALVDADSAAIALSSANARRYRALASDGSASVQEEQESASRLDADMAARRRDVAAHAASGQETEVLNAQLAGANAAIARAEAALDAARLRLSYTRIVAPVDGVVGRRSVRVGNFVDVGKPLLAVVPLDKAYVEAHFRETQMRKIRPGQPVTVKVDMLPGVALKAHVESLAPASGVTFAEIAPENATGNFTKIVQRLSVRIRIDPGQPDADRLRVGMSVTPTVDTKVAS
ncbi:HlyD family secretion protein [Sphingomonas sp. PR090111-T3T-6A]|uniref:HlyD family secretion protein n=1 Tax=Sphingomonas sp. PR090111-T3T-6A TaxID=685778 RepID=UPI0003792CE4|nr:HlyD family secretion protein [Sphingomonas sp. PR090111-T3T-6A]